MKICILSPLVFVSALFCASSAFAFDWKSETGEIVIPANTEAVVTDGDVPDVEKLTKITMGNYASKIKFANDTVPLVLNADILSGGGANTPVRWLAMTEGSRVTFNGAISPNNTATYIDLGTCTINGTFNGYSLNAHYGFIDGCTATFSDAAIVKSATSELRLDSISLNVNGYAPDCTLKFGCRVPASGNVGTVYFLAPKIELSAADVFAGCGVLNFTPGPRDGKDFEVPFDLGGFDQTVGRLSVVSTTSASWFRSPIMLEIASEEPATLTSTFEAEATFEYIYRVRVAGAASFVYDAPCTVRFANDPRPTSNCENWANIKGVKSISTTTGSLTVKRGTLAFADGTEWHGPDVLVKAGACLKQEGANTFTNEDAVITVESGATLSVAAGTVVVGKKFVLAGKELTTPGVYGASELEERGYEAVLTGGGQLKIVAPKGEFVWPESGEQAIVPAGGVALITDAEVARANGVKGFTVFAGGRLVISNITESCDLQVPVGGDGDIYVIDSLGVVFSADNSKRLGNFIVRNSEVTCAHQQGFGSTASPALSFTQGEQGKLQFSGAGLTCDSPITVESDSHELSIRAAGNARITLNGAFRLMKDGSKTVFGNVTFNGSFYKKNQMVYADFGIDRGCAVAFNGGSEFGFTMAIPWEGNIRFGDAVGYGVMRYSGGSSSLVLDATNVLNSTTYNGGTIIAASALQIDLNGYPQVVTQIQTGDDSRTAVSNDWVSVLTPADKPAVLTYQPAFNSNPNYTVCKQLSMKTTGPLGLTYDGGNYTRTVVLHPQEATGPLTVKSGTLGFDWGATWAKGTEVYLEGGTLKVGAESVSGMFSRKANLVVMDGALELAAGETATVRSVKLKGEFVPAGTYTKGELSFLTGDGSLRVRNSSDQTGLMLLFR